MSTAQLNAATIDVLAGIALILLAAALLARVARKLHQPPVVAEILAGVALGPSLLGLLPGHLDTRLFPDAGRSFLNVISQVGIALFMFLVGWEFNRGVLRGRSRTAVASVSLCALALPFAGGAALALLFYSRHDQVAGRHVGHTAFVLYLGVAVSITAFPVLARFLKDSRVGDTRVGQIALASAATGDALSWCLLAVVIAIVQSSGSQGLLRMAAELAGFALVLVLVVRPGLELLVRRWAVNGGSPYLLAPIAAGALLSASATSWIGIHAFFGAFAFGCVMPRSPSAPLTRYLRAPLHQVSLLLLPVFFIVVGLSVNLGALRGGDLVEAAAMIAVASAGKIVGASVPGRITGLGWRDAAQLGVLMNMRGLTELIVLNVGVSMGVLDQRMYAIMVVMALVTTSAAGLLIPYRPESVAFPFPEGSAERVAESSTAV